MSAPPGYENNTVTVTVGDDFGLDRTMNDIPDGQAIAQATWTVKNLSDLTTPGDAAAIWKKVLTTTNVVNVGQIEDNGAISRVGKLRWEGTDTESLLLTPGVEYVYDIQVVSTAGKTYTQERGMLVAYAQVTQA